MEALRKVFSREGVLTIVGMATMWTSVHNQLMYPITFTYVKDGAPPVFMLYIAYAFLELFTCIALYLLREKTMATLFRNPIVMGILGSMGTLGTFLLVTSDFSTTFSTILVAIGVALVALYVPLFFAFWSLRLCSLGDGTHSDGGIVALAIIASYILFSLFTGGRLILDIHASMLGVFYPAIGTILAVVSLRISRPGTSLQGTFTARQLPLNIIVPSLAFVYLCSIIITVLNPTSSLSEYPPQREVLYIVDAILFVIIGAIYVKSPDAFKRSSMQTFAVLSIYLVGAVLLTALGTLDALNVGNFPAIAGKNAFDLFILLLILVTAHNKHVNPIGAVSVYFVADMWLSHFITAVITQQGTVASLSANNVMYVFAFIVVAAFLVSATVNVILIFFVVRTPKAQVSEHPANPSAEIEQRVFEQVQAAWGLSNREVDIVRLVCKNAQTAKIADSLCIAESTVYTHLKRIYRKAGVHSKYELIDLVETFKK